jgi:Uma2 family endonuclease
MSAETIPVIGEQSPPRTAGTGLMSVAEYLAMERESDIRHEYVDGYIRAMSGETPQHNRIAGNVYFKLETVFQTRPCTSYFEGVRVRVTPTQYRYPDVVALCGQEQFDNDNPPALLNPSLIVEVLSPSTQEKDRNDKFIEYSNIPELMDYLLVEQDHVMVIHYSRQDEMQWTVRKYSSMTESLHLASVDVAITLQDIYRKISMTDALTETASSAVE